MKEETSETKTILVFSAELQRESPHTVDVDGNGEVVLTCTETERFLKFPKGTTAEELKAAIIKHKESNEGQISKASIEAEKENLIHELTVDTQKGATPEEIL